MNWYKKAQTEFPTWLSRELAKETEDYQNFKDKRYPTLPITDRMAIERIRVWIENTNPNLEKYTLQEADEEADLWYRRQAPTPNLKLEDIDQDAIMAELQQKAPRSVLHNLPGADLDPDSLKIYGIDMVKISPEWHTDQILIRININDKDGKFIKTISAVLLTKDGKYMETQTLGAYANPCVDFPSHSSSKD